MFTPQQIDKIIAFTNTPIRLTADEREIFLQVRANREPDPFDGDMEELYQGQALFPSAFAYPFHAPLSLNRKINKSAQRLIMMTLAEWPLRVGELSQQSSTDLNATIGKLIELESKAAPTPATVMLVLANNVFKQIQSDVLKAIKSSDAFTEEKRSRTFFTLLVLYENNFLIMLPKIFLHGLNTNGVSQDNLKRSFKACSHKFLANKRKTGGRIFHCPAHGLIGSLFVGKQGQAAMLSLFEKISLITPFKPNDAEPSCPFNHGKTRAPESLEPKG